jgi:hypothetical protein
MVLGLVHWPVGRRDGGHGCGARHVIIRSTSSVDSVETQMPCMCNSLFSWFILPHERWMKSARVPNAYHCGIGFENL